MRRKKVEQKEPAELTRSAENERSPKEQDNWKKVRAIIEGVNKVFKDEILSTGAKAFTPKRIPTGSRMLDAILGGGYVMGKIHELFGEFGSGKSTIILKGIAEQQRVGLVCALIDSEMSFDAKYAQMCGVDLDSLILHQDNRQEVVINLVEVLASNGAVNVIYLDSVQGLVPERVEEKGADEPTMGIEARLNNLLMRKLLRTMKETGKEPHCCTVLVSQTRAVIGGGSSHPLPPQPGGGQAVKFFKHISVRVKRGEKLGANGEKAQAGKPVCGIEIVFHVEKNKTARSFLTGYTKFYFADASEVGIRGGQIDHVSEFSLLARQLGIAKQFGAYYELDGQRFHGEDALNAYLRLLGDTKDLEARIIAAFKGEMSDPVGAVVPEESVEGT